LRLAAKEFGLFGRTFGSFAGGLGLLAGIFEFPAPIFEISARSFAIDAWQLDSGTPKTKGAACFSTNCTRHTYGGDKPILHNLNHRFARRGSVTAAFKPFAQIFINDLGIRNIKASAVFDGIVVAQGAYISLGSRHHQGVVQIALQLLQVAVHGQEGFFGDKVLPEFNIPLNFVNL